MIAGIVYYNAVEITKIYQEWPYTLTENDQGFIISTMEGEFQVVPIGAMDKYRAWEILDYMVCAVNEKRE